MWEAPLGASFFHGAAAFFEEDFFDDFLLDCFFEGSSGEEALFFLEVVLRTVAPVFLPAVFLAMLMHRMAGARRTRSVLRMPLRAFCTSHSACEEYRVSALPKGA